jgi:hypothetical protein
VNKGEATAALMGIDLALSFDYSKLLIESDSLVTILAINMLSLFPNWTLSPMISDILLKVHYFQVWNASKVSNSANLRAHYLAKWATNNLVFENIPKFLLLTIRFCCIF